MKNFITIKNEVETEEIINKSRFITNLYKVTTEEEAKDFIAEIKSTHKGANHHCSAYVIGDAHQIQKANDDGEPSGTAGVPMLETLKKEEVHNVVAIVTRYFGGIKLGTGGLIRAYQSGVTQAIQSSGKVSIENAESYQVKLAYDLTGKFEYELMNTPFSLINTEYSDLVTYTLHIKAQDADAFHQFVNNQTSGSAEIIHLESLMLPFDVS